MKTKTESRGVPGARSRDGRDRFNIRSVCGSRMFKALHTVKWHECRAPGRSCRALLLLDCMVYMAVLSIVLSLAFAAFYRIDTSTRALSRNAADIVRATQAGERWRDELRASKGVRLDEDFVLHVEKTAGGVRYAFRENAVWRQVDGTTTWMPFLAGVRSSRMIADPRAHVTAWRWEVELKAAQKVARVRPLFSFSTVAPAAGKQQ